MIFSSGASDAAGRRRWRSSASVSVAVPRLPTTTEAAALAARIAGSNGAFIASNSAITVATVSPAPETSRTFTGWAATWTGACTLDV